MMTKSGLSTLMGWVVAIANAWINVDWKDFEPQKEWPKLVISAMIAIGGHVTKVEIKKEDK